jgi:4-alpha-glucanotransferase
VIGINRPDGWFVLAVEAESITNDIEDLKMKFPRASGVLLHPTSLPGRFGVGDLGPEAWRFVDLLETMGQSLWQVLPLGPTGYGDSPYQCFSAFAGNPLLISLEMLVTDGLLAESDLAEVPEFPTTEVDYGPVIEFKTRLLRRAYDNFEASPDLADLAELRQACQLFASQAGWWLEDYALFRSIKDYHGGCEWTRWDPYLRDRQDDALHFFRENHGREIGLHKFLQFIFFRQWLGLASYANERGIKIIGDIPIFVAHDSADVWAHRELYHLDEAGMPTVVAGVPPDYFSADGQLWGNPLYRWELMAGDGYRWWISRIRATLGTVDIVRLDHFRGFEKYWAVPAGETTARNGSWEQGPEGKFFEAISRELGALPIIAEDLGVITPEVRRLRDRFGLPGMQILQFGFSPDPEADGLKPYSFVPNSVVYTGTHDNDTTCGWFAARGGSTLGADVIDAERELLLRYLGTDGSEINWDLIRLALASVANMAIIPLQDLLGLGSEARMNTPARESGNWGWRFDAEQLTPSIQQRFLDLTETYGRNRGRLKAELRQAEN